MEYECGDLKVERNVKLLYLEGEGVSKCKKHDCRYETRKMEHGKTMQVCPECEREQLDKFKEMFGIKEESTFNPPWPFGPGEVDV